MMQTHNSLEIIPRMSLGTASSWLAVLPQMLHLPASGIQVEGMQFIQLECKKQVNTAFEETQPAMRSFQGMFVLMAIVRGLYQFCYAIT